MNILVVGATGILGRTVIPRLLERGYNVRAVVRGNDQTRFLQQMGVETVMGDIFDRKSLENAARGSHAALHLATAIPKNGNGDWRLNDLVRREGTRNLLDSLIKKGVKRYIQQSITLVYGENGQELVDESAPLQVTAISQSAIEMEDMVRTSGLEWSILRGGLFYGPGTGREEDWWASARQGRLRIPGDGSDLTSLIHIADMARAVVAALERAPAGSIYNITDDEPAKYQDLFNHIATQVGVRQPETGDPRFLPSLGVRNVKAQIELVWRPAYPNYQIGLAYGPLGIGINSGMQVTTSPRTADQVQAEAVL